jgi:hypothetical protein
VVEGSIPSGPATPLNSTEPEQTLFIRGYTVIHMSVGGRRTRARRQALLLLLAIICATSLLGLTPVSADPTNLTWGKQGPWPDWSSMAMPFTFKSGNVIEVDIQVISGMFNMYIINDADWQSGGGFGPYNHVLAKAAYVMVNATISAQIPSDGQYWVVINVNGTPNPTNNTVSYQVWLLGTTSLPPIPNPQIYNPLFTIGLASSATTLLTMLVFIARRRQSTQVASNKSKAPPSTINTSTEPTSTYKPQKRHPAPLATGTCTVCRLEIADNEPYTTCPSCGGKAHTTHMLEWLHVHDYCPACGKPLREQDFEQST